MNITKVNIIAFRNLHNISFNCKERIIIKGNNMQGKTNILNALYWCITGTDLNGSNDNLLNLPFGEETASVEIEFENHKIKRTANKVDNSVEQHICIDNEEKPLKQAENSILDLFSLSKVALNDTKGFKILRFLLNPLYWKSVAPSELRAYVIKAIFGNMKECDIVDKCNLSDKVKNLVKSGIATYGSLALFSTYNDTATRRLVKQIKEDVIVANWLHEHNLMEQFTSVMEEKHNLEKSLLEYEEKKIVIEETAIEFSKYYQNYFNSKNISITLLEKGQGEDVYHEVCYPQLFDVRTSKNNGSTAETIYTSAAFVELIRSLLNLPVLPLFIDEGETLDEKSLSNLSNTNTQLFISMVEFNKAEKISIGE